MERSFKDGCLTLDLTANVQETLLPELEGKTLAVDSTELASRKRRRYIAARDISQEDQDDNYCQVWCSI